VLAIIDPVRPRAQAVLDDKLASRGGEAYKGTVLFNDTAEYIGEEPDAVFIGTPPAFRGTMMAGRDVEIVASKKFASSALFVEKPISSAYPSHVQPLIPYFRQTGTFVAVGYMLRYLKGLRNYTRMD
jgi:predicted dehydrogenase